MKVNEVNDPAKPVTFKAKVHHSQKQCMYHMYRFLLLPAAGPLVAGAAALSNLSFFQTAGLRFTGQSLRR